MVTSNDRAFSILIACDGGIGLKKMPYFMYMMQSAGFDVNYRYTIKTDRMRSHGLSRDINTMISGGLINGSYGLTEKGDDELLKYHLTFLEDSLCDSILDIAGSLSLHELYVLCVIDIIVMGVLENNGYVGLMKGKAKILEDTRYLCGDVSDEDFDYCIGIMRVLRKKRKEVECR